MREEPTFIAGAIASAASTSSGSAPWKVSPPNALRGELPVLAHYKDKVRAAFIALFQDDKLFLVKGKFSGCWQLPGGSVDKSDTNVWEGATREFYEETGCVAPLPPVDLLGWFQTTIDFGSGAFVGLTLVLKAKTSAEIPWAPGDEVSECAMVKWGSELEGLTYRWPNDQTIPLIHDKSLPEGGRRPAVKPGPWSTHRPVLQAGGAPGQAPESAGAAEEPRRSDDRLPMQPDKKLPRQASQGDGLPKSAAAAPQSGTSSTAASDGPPQPGKPRTPAGDGPTPWKVSPPNALRGELPVLAHYKDKVRAAFIALFQEDKLFLVKGKFSGCWQLPGGSIDQSDLNVWEGATREFYEETGCVAPLPPVDLLGWFETTIDFGSGPFAGVVLVLKAKSAAEIPWAPADETSECAVVTWGVELEGLTYRWPNDQTIPLIYDKSNSEGGSRPAVKRGPWSACRPVLRAGGGQKEVAA